MAHKVPLPMKLDTKHSAKRLQKIVSLILTGTNWSNAIKDTLYIGRAPLELRGEIAPGDQFWTKLAMITMFDNDKSNRKKHTRFFYIRT